MLCAARLRRVVGTVWERKHYLNMDLLKDMKMENEQELLEAVLLNQGRCQNKGAKNI